VKSERTTVLKTHLARIPTAGSLASAIPASLATVASRVKTLTSASAECIIATSTLAVQTLKVPSAAAATMDSSTTTASVTTSTSAKTIPSAARTRIATIELELSNALVDTDLSRTATAVASIMTSALVFPCFRIALQKLIYVHFFLFFDMFIQFFYKNGCVKENYNLQM
jgi:hypothetical protein